MIRGCSKINLKRYFTKRYILEVIYNKKLDIIKFHLYNNKQSNVHKTKEFRFSENCRKSLAVHSDI